MGRGRGDRTPTTRPFDCERVERGGGGELISDDYRSRHPLPFSLTRQHTPPLTPSPRISATTTNGVHRLTINTVKQYPPPPKKPLHNGRRLVITTVLDDRRSAQCFWKKITRTFLQINIGIYFITIFVCVQAFYQGGGEGNWSGSYHPMVICFLYYNMIFFLPVTC